MKSVHEETWSWQPSKQRDMTHSSFVRSFSLQAISSGVQWAAETRSIACQCCSSNGSTWQRSIGIGFIVITVHLSSSPPTRSIGSTTINCFLSRHARVRSTDTVSSRRCLPIVLDRDAEILREKLSDVHSHDIDEKRMWRKYYGLTFVVCIQWETKIKNHVRSNESARCHCTVGVRRLPLFLSNMRVIKCTNRHIHSSLQVVPEKKCREENYSLHLSECLDASSHRICMFWIRADVWLIELMPSSSSISFDSTACRITSEIISTNASAATQPSDRKRWYLADDKSSSINLSSFFLINLRRRFPHRLFSHLSIGTRSIYLRQSTLFLLSWH